MLLIQPGGDKVVTVGFSQRTRILAPVLSTWTGLVTQLPLHVPVVQVPGSWWACVNGWFYMFLNPDVAPHFQPSWSSSHSKFATPYEQYDWGNNINFIFVSTWSQMRRNVRVAAYMFYTTLIYLDMWYTTWWPGILQGSLGPVSGGSRQRSTPSGWWLGGYNGYTTKVWTQLLDPNMGILTFPTGSQTAAPFDFQALRELVWDPVWTQFGSYFFRGKQLKSGWILGTPQSMPL